MGDMGEAMKEYGEILKQKHDERVLKNPDRVEYAIEQFEKHGIEYQLKNPGIGHFHCWRKRDRKLYQFWASTGKIMGHDRARGIHALVRILCKEGR